MLDGLRTAVVKDRGLEKFPDGLLIRAAKVTNRGLEAPQGLRTAIAANRGLGADQKRPAITKIDARDVTDAGDRSHATDVVVGSGLHTVGVAISTANGTLDCLKATMLNRALSNSLDVLDNNRVFADSEAGTAVSGTERWLSELRDLSRDRSTVGSEAESLADGAKVDNKRGTAGEATRAASETSLRETTFGEGRLAPAVHNDNRRPALALNDSTAADNGFLIVVLSSTVVAIEAFSSELLATVTTESLNGAKMAKSLNGAEDRLSE